MAQACDVSVIVPTYNRGDLLRERIDSVLNQSGAPYEAIYVDDGSTDDTPEVLASYGSRLRVIRTENAGPGPARNAGAREARGTLLLFTDDDTVVPSDWVARMAESYARHGREALSGGFTPHSLATPIERYLHYRMRTVLAEEAKDVSAAPMMNFMISRRLFEEVGGFSTARLSAAEDWEFCLRLRQQCVRIAYDPSVCVRHRYQSGRAAAVRRIRAAGADGLRACATHYGSVTAYTAYSLLRFLSCPFWLPRHYPVDLYGLALRMESEFIRARLAAFLSGQWRL